MSDGEKSTEMLETPKEVKMLRMSPSSLQRDLVETNLEAEEPHEVDIDMTSLAEGKLDERDLRKKQVFGGWKLAWLVYQSLGVIYGDIGTSPLYVYSSTFTSEPSYDDVLGAVSLVIWALTIMVTIKYVFIVLLADDEGDGGTFALYSLLSRYANLVRYDPRYSNMVRMERHATNDLKKPNLMTRSFIEKSTIVKWMLKVVGAFGVALLLADGVLTPAQSILGAIQGASVVNPDISTSVIVGASCAILVLVFIIQPLGTSKIASTFAPIVILWMLFNLTFGIYNLVKYDASVFKAFSPYFAGAYLVRNKRAGWMSLGGILLAFTGVETMFADLGAFSRRAVQLSWLCFVYPCLLISYIGQGAHIIVHPSAYANPFYLTVPPGMLWPSLIVAVLACIVASQAVITGAYQTTRIGEAYGTCVILVSFLTTCMVTIVALIVWRLPIWIVLPIFVVFALWDGMFLSAALSKVPSGAWFTLMIAIVLTCIFMLWRYGKEEQWKAEESDNLPLSQTLILHQDSIYLKTEKGSAQITPIQGLGIFFDKSGSSINAPTVFLHFLQKFNAMPEVTVFLHLRPLSIPTVAPEERYAVTLCSTRDENGCKKAIPNCYRLIVRHGYTDEIVTPDLGVLVHDIIRAFLKLYDRSSEEDRGIVALTRASESQIIYIVGKEQLKVAANRNYFRRAVLWVFLLFKASSRSKVQNLNVETERVVEVGFVKTM
ncbi:potassium transporter [Penicillium malachiteum]|uniref:Potassium transporter n=1 Tax=Penicillium malachiteum TaxID=1324776 RepID=A0AAD6HJ53_9EURO|nr:potassium transporter [Penicillium malachiteum]